MNRHRQRGISLIELVVFIIVVGVALAGVLSVMDMVTRHSADPMVRKQSMAMAEAILEEVAHKAYADPDGSEAGETRISFDDVMDYNGLTIAGNDTLGSAPIALLSGYSAAIAVTDKAIGPAGNTVAMKEIQVEVTDPFNQKLRMLGYRANY
jgi:MSHA pilin protein MshD